MQQQRQRMMRRQNHPEKHLVAYSHTLLTAGRCVEAKRNSKCHDTMQYRRHYPPGKNVVQDERGVSGILKAISWQR